MAAKCHPEQRHTLQADMLLLGLGLSGLLRMFMVTYSAYFGVCWTAVLFLIHHDVFASSLLYEFS